MIAVSRHATWTVISLGGRLDRPGIVTLRYLYHDLGDDAGDLAFDLSNIEFIDENGLRVLGQALRRARSHRRRVVVVSVPGTIRNLLEASGIGRRLSMYPSINELPNHRAAS